MITYLDTVALCLQPCAWCAAGLLLLLARLALRCRMVPGAAMYNKIFGRRNKELFFGAGRRTQTNKDQ